MEFFGARPSGTVSTCIEEIESSDAFIGMHLRIQGRRGKIRFVPVHPMALRFIEEYLEPGKHGGAPMHNSLDEALFRPVKNNRTGNLDKHLDPGSIYPQYPP
jgi:hypothetical protein